MFEGASDAALLVAALATTTAGMACLALSIGAHWEQLVGARPHPRAVRVVLRLAGAALFGLAFALCAAADPVSMAVLVWTMLLTAGAGLVAAALALSAGASRGRRNRAARATPADA